MSDFFKLWSLEFRRQTGYVAENQRLFNIWPDQFCVLLRKFYPDWNPELCSEQIDCFHLPETGSILTGDALESGSAGRRVCRCSTIPHLDSTPRHGANSWTAFSKRFKSSGTRF